MANVIWSGNQVDRAYTSLVQVTAVGTPGTITATINSKTETYTATGTDTTTTAASNAVAQFSNSPIAEFRLAAWSNPTAGFMQATGPSDGRPLAVTWGASGSCTVGAATTSAATSSHNVSDTANWVGGVLPGNGDQIVAQGDTPDMLYGLAQFTALTVSLFRDASYTGSVGLSDWNDLGFPEYLPTRIELAGLTLNLVSGGTGTTRIKSTAGSAVTATCRGTGSTEVFEFTGLPASSTLNANQCGVVVAPNVGDTATIATALIAETAALRTGPGCTITTATVMSSTGSISGTVTTLTSDRGAVVTFYLAAAATTLNIPGGTVNWNSTGGVGTVTISNGGLLDLSLAPGTVTTSGITCNSGGSILNPWKRMASYTLSGNDWLGVRNLIDIGTSFSLTVT